jgi:hypothetical protein
LLLADELMLQRNQHKSTAISVSKGYSKGDLKDVDDPKLNVEYAPHLPVRARTLSNQERLVLRKQALKMKKRPVLSIGIFLLFVPVTVKKYQIAVLSI